MKKWLIVVAFLFLVVVLASFLLPKETDKNVLDGLTLEQKIGQLFIIGIDGYEVDEEIEDLIKTLHPGGILLLGKNVKNESQVKKLISDLQKVSLQDSGVPLFIAVDQEGGLISRIDWVEKTPQSEIKKQEEAYNIAKERAGRLKELRINLNLAPLLDEAVEGDFIFDRTFKKELEEIAPLALGIIRGQKDAGILTAIKHFPGYGGISFNPEDKLAEVDEIPEIYQFKVAAQSEPEMIMMANVVYKGIDSDIPSTFSEKVVQFLKKEIPGNYLIISDDLAQYSLLDNFPLEDIVSQPIKAGVDLLIFSGWREPVESGLRAFKDALNRGQIKEEDINQKVLKIIKLKSAETELY